MKEAAKQSSHTPVRVELGEGYYRFNIHQTPDPKEVERMVEDMKVSFERSYVATVSSEERRAEQPGSASPTSE